MTEKKVKDDFVRKMVEDYKSGLGTDRIAKNFKIGKTTVRKYLLKAGIKFRTAPKDVISKSLHEEFIRLYNQGQSIKQIAAKTGYNFATVQRHLYKAHVKLKLRGNPKSISQSAGELTLEKSYILGVVGPGDGFIEIPKNYPKQGTMRICLEAIDKDFIDYFAFCLKKVYGLEPITKLLKWREGDAHPHYKVILYSKVACDDILSYGVSFREKSWKVPDAIKNAPLEIKAKYLQGFADSQGCVSTNRAILLASKNTEGIRELKELFDSLGIRANLINLGLGVTSKDNLVKFSQQINFVISRKNERLSNAISSYVRK